MGASEGAEERVALCVDLDPAVPGEGIAHEVAVLLKRLLVAIAQLGHQPGRALDVAE